MWDSRIAKALDYRDASPTQKRGVLLVIHCIFKALLRFLNYTMASSAFHGMGAARYYLQNTGPSYRANYDITLIRSNRLRFMLEAVRVPDTPDSILYMIFRYQF